MATTIVNGDRDGGAGDLIIIRDAERSGWAWQVGVGDAGLSNDPGLQVNRGKFGDATSLGNIIHLSAIGANVAQAGNQAFVCGSRGIGALILGTSGTDRLVPLNTDADAAFEMVIMRADGAVLSSGCSADEFAL